MSNQKMFYKSFIYAGVLLLILVLLGAARMQARASTTPDLISQGKQIFRFDTFGDEDFWADNSSCIRRLKERSSMALDRA